MRYLIVLLLFIGCKNAEKSTSLPEENEQVEVAENIEEPKNEIVNIATPYGTMKVMLYDETPLHKANFLKLAEAGFYDSLLFHRVIRDFMIQGGDPNSKGAAPGMPLGTGGPGYKIPAEFDAKYIHKKGALAAARQGAGNPEKKSSGSQFYIVQGKTANDAQLSGAEMKVRRDFPGFAYTAEQREIYKTIGGTPHLDMAYTVFGEVIEGLNIVDSIAQVRTGQGNRPVIDVTMNMTLSKN